MTHKPRFLRVTSLLVALTLQSTTFASMSDLASFVKAKKYQDAYDEALTLYDEHAGDPAFDFYFGFAALETGKYDEAVFPLERALVLQPTNDRIRLELARALYHVADYTESARLFTEVKNSSTTPQVVKNNIDIFLNLIKDKTRLQKPYLSNKISINTGFDNNINSAADIDTITVPFIVSGNTVNTVFNVNESSKPIENAFVQVTGNSDYFYPVASQTSSKFGVSGSHRFNRENRRLNYGNFNLHGQLNHDMENFIVGVSGQAQTTILNNEHYRNVFSMNFKISKPSKNKTGNISAFFNVAKLDYQTDDTNNVALFMLGGGRAYYVKSIRTVFTANGYAAFEQAEFTAGKHNGRRFAGVTLASEFYQLKRHKPYIAINFNRSLYNADHPLFKETRKDITLDARAGVLTNLGKDLSAKFEVKYNYNHSRIDVFSYDRTQFITGIEYKF